MFVVVNSVLFSKDIEMGANESTTSFLKHFPYSEYSESQAISGYPQHEIVNRTQCRPLPV
jgi:hypothetical protein